jgi:hypothetical protein
VRAFHPATRPVSEFPVNCRPFPKPCCHHRMESAWWPVRWPGSKGGADLKTRRRSKLSSRLKPPLTVTAMFAEPCGNNLE